MNNTQTESKAPEALMLLSGSCSFCPSVLDSLSKMIKAGDIGSLKVINLERNPEAMQEYQVRSVPWVRIGKYELSGAQTLEALKQRAVWAQNDLQHKDNSVADFDFLLSDGQVNKVIQAIRDDPEKMQSIMQLLGDPGTVLSSRIGIGVVFEEFANSELLRSLIPQLVELTRHEDQRIRADAYHYLGMTGDPEALPALEIGIQDKDKEVSEIARDALEDLQKKLNA